MKLLFASHVTLRFMKLINFSRGITEFLYRSPHHLQLLYVISARFVSIISWYFFCLDDRALLCNDCDGAIHICNSHQRFLLSGVQASDQSLTESSGCSTNLISETYQIQSKASLNSQYSSEENEAGNSGETDKTPSVILSP
ncbi:hypothetical protein Bca52824_003979 [Brassica carinata]|uniref:B box-type domain-containing protein n=1 Tax=Brassica carinata TaxID=52824 RepID=A0A8X8BBY1_BRACI|nr:hypothetical protein Bca52824_003979 [Brassica carinata]